MVRGRRPSIPAADPVRMERMDFSMVSKLAHKGGVPLLSCWDNELLVDGCLAFSFDIISSSGAFIVSLEVIRARAARMSPTLILGANS